MANIIQNRAVFEVTEKLYLNAELADVNFLIKINDKVQRIPANKAILAVRSSGAFHELQVFFPSMKIQYKLCQIVQFFVACFLGR